MRNRLKLITLLGLVGINIILLPACKDQSKSQLPVDLPRQDVFVVDRFFAIASLKTLTYGCRIYQAQLDKV